MIQFNASINAFVKSTKLTSDNENYELMDAFSDNFPSLVCGFYCRYGCSLDFAILDG